MKRKRYKMIMRRWIDREDKGDKDILSDIPEENN